MGTCRKFQSLLLCREIQSYEEFYNLVQGDDEHFDDEHAAATDSAVFHSRSFYGKDVYFYEELYNLIGGGHDVFDDDLPPAARSRHFYGTEIQSYEELYIIAGADAIFDDEHA